MIGNASGPASHAKTVSDMAEPKGIRSRRRAAGRRRRRALSASASTHSGAVRSLLRSTSRTSAHGEDEHLDDHAEVRRAHSARLGGATPSGVRGSAFARPRPSGSSRRCRLAYRADTVSRQAASRAAGSAPHAPIGPRARCPRAPRESSTSPWRILLAQLGSPSATARPPGSSAIGVHAGGRAQRQGRRRVAVDAAPVPAGHRNGLTKPDLQDRVDERERRRPRSPPRRERVQPLEPQRDRALVVASHRREALFYGAPGLGPRARLADWPVRIRDSGVAGDPRFMALWISAPARRAALELVRVERFLLEQRFGDRASPPRGCGRGARSARS